MLMKTFTLEIKVFDKAASVNIIDTTNNNDFIIHSMMNNTDEQTNIIILSVASSLQNVELLKQKLQQLELIEKVTIQEK